MDDVKAPKKRFFSTLRILVVIILLAAGIVIYMRFAMNLRIGGQQVYDNLAVFDTRLQNVENSILLHEKRIKDLEDATQKLATAPASVPMVTAPTTAASSPAASNAATPAASPAPATAANDDRIAALEKEIGALKAASPLQDNETIYKSIRLLSAFHRLSDKVIGGKPFASELTSFEEIATPDESAGSPINTLAPYAESGIPTFATLLVTFDQSVDAVNATEAIPPANATFYQRLQYNLTHLISIRRIDDSQTGNTTDAIIGRAQAHLEREEIEAAAAEIKSLPDTLRSNFTAWLDDAQMVTEAPSLIDQLDEQVILKAFHAEVPAQKSPSQPQISSPAAATKSTTAKPE